MATATTPADLEAFDRLAAEYLGDAASAGERLQAALQRRHRPATEEDPKPTTIFYHIHKSGAQGRACLWTAVSCGLRAQACCCRARQLPSRCPPRLPPPPTPTHPPHTLRRLLHV